MKPRVARWAKTWESRDLDAIMALYAPDATHASALVSTVWPELGRTTLVGATELREYFRRGLARFTWLRFDVQSVIETGERSAVEYLRRSNLDADHPRHVLEMLEWNGDLLRAVRVFHA